MVKLPSNCLAINTSTHHQKNETHRFVYLFSNDPTCVCCCCCCCCFPKTPQKKTQHQQIFLNPPKKKASTSIHQKSNSTKRPFFDELKKLKPCFSQSFVHVPESGTILRSPNPGGKSWYVEDGKMRIQGKLTTKTRRQFHIVLCCGCGGGGGCCCCRLENMVYKKKHVFFFPGGYLIQNNMVIVIERLRSTHTSQRWWSHRHLRAIE